MKKIFLLVIVCCTKVCTAQNLVPNSSFEDENFCEFNLPCSPAAWFYIVKSEVAGYFTDQMPAATGKRWLSIVAGNRLNKGGRQYWQTMLLHTLEEGKQYKITIKIHGWDIEPNTNDIGLYLTNKMVFYETDTVLQPKNYIQFSGAKVKQEKNGWFSLEKEYTATAADQYLVIGNFSDQDYQEVAKKRFSRSMYIGVTVDDVSITPVTPFVCTDCQHTKDSLYASRNRHPSQPAPTPTKPGTIIQTHSSKIDTLVLDNIYFKTASYNINNPEIFEPYRKVFTDAAVSKIRILGYTDDAGNVNGNKILSGQRAEAVARLIVAKFGVNYALIETEGMGVSDSFNNKSKNRRVEILLFH